MDDMAQFQLPEEERRRLLFSNLMMGLGAGLLDSRGKNIWGPMSAGLLGGMQMGQQAIGDARRGMVDSYKLKREVEQDREQKAMRDAAAGFNQALGGILDQVKTDPAKASQIYTNAANEALKFNDLKRAEQLFKEAEKYRAKYSATPHTVMRNGKPVLVQTSEYDAPRELDGFQPKPEIELRDMGGSVQAFDKLGTAPGSAFAKSLTPEGAQQDRQWQADYELRRNADQRAANTARAAAEKGATADPKVVSELRKEFNALDAVKAFNQVQPVLQSAREAVGVDNAAADLNLVYAAAKIMDPTSVVRESETTMVVNSGSPAQKYVGVFNHIVGGGRLTETVRKNLMREVESRGRGYESGYNVARKAYENIAAKNNIPADQVFIEPFVKSSPQQGSAQGRSVVRTGTNRKTGRKVVQYSDGTVEEQ